MKYIIFKICVLFMAAVFLSGCALFLSDVQRLWEIKEAHTKVFDKDVADCYDMTLSALAKWGAIAFQQRQDDYIVGMQFENIFKSCIDTTEVGIFFTQTDPHKTEVKVTSLNYNLSRAISQKLFEYIEKDGK
ncbi:MAG: hypothetical protein PHN63_03305 [Candidatus Omnitrophica bacterium]|nr:hypothetical protein [Candidatus Omnitrophota bacterium]